ncbi:hypothetical protein [Amnibacterium endophyticum]|uniref:Uncharacterized protein n=1 Tax=Amnibacterium endophyticum TaxID=2109337 RepID=A0ABW4LK55_9MICO
MLRLAAPLIALAIAVAAGAAAPADAAEAAPVLQRTSTATGHDVSYPQCGRVLPTRGDIAVVGVNAGTGVTTNPCLAEQLAWGDAPAADGTPRLADVYVNTANPGHLGGWWPYADLTRTGIPVTNPEGTCVGAEDAACAYVYGWSIGADDVLRRGVPRAGERTWWLDVETMNTWSWDREANLAVLEGMAAAIRAVGGDVGIYSTTRQWGLIVGDAAPSSALAGAPSWTAGAITRAGALENCREPAFTPGGRTVMSQWVQDGQDHDIACRPGVVGTVPSIDGDPVVGGRLTADPGAWGPAGVGIAYRWSRDGVPIAGATSPAYAPTAEDAGAALTLQVRGTRADAPALALTSAPVVVAPAPLPSPAATSTPPIPAPPATPTATPTDTAAPTTPPSDAPSTPATPAPPSSSPAAGSDEA